ncbi:DUF6270 domain-containing protein [Gluconacetobacter sp. Hr-1-5]|uniref:DUF6270 domain-containing protein n=1 Tax=Gluconacetobacter sp. Hr-1-5 TaxID=3395370 RepID=UPI003B52FCDD
METKNRKLATIVSNSLSSYGKHSQFPSHVRILSLGGCITHDICKMVECFAVKHSDHLWRRPTIPLMSKAPQRLPFMDHDFPSELTRYWQDDFRKNHLRELEEADDDILIFDITRDIFCAVYEIEAFSYVIDPMSVEGILFKHNPIFNDEKIKSAIGKYIKRFDFNDEAYFDAWKFYFDNFVHMAQKFDKIILNKIYFTNKVASHSNEMFGDGNYTSSVNAFLDTAYEYIKRNYSNIIINEVPRNVLMTGHDVSWDGPWYTHFIPEATALFSENVREIILGDRYKKGGIFIKYAIDGAKKREDLSRNSKNLISERDALAEERDALRGYLGEATQQRDALAEERDALRGYLGEATQQRDALAEERDALRSYLAEATQQRDAITAQLHAIATERDALHAYFAEATTARSVCRETQQSGLQNIYHPELVIHASAHE